MTSNTLRIILPIHLLTYHLFYFKKVNYPSHSSTKKLYNFSFNKNRGRVFFFFFLLSPIFHQETQPVCLYIFFSSFNEEKGHDSKACVCQACSSWSALLLISSHLVPCAMKGRTCLSVFPVQLLLYPPLHYTIWASFFLSPRTRKHTFFTRVLTYQT